MASTASERILTLDVIRGIAVMGIFSVNVVGMGMIERAYFYPPDYGFDSPGDRVVWALNAIFVDGRFRSLFSILFGASLTVVVERAVAAGKQGWQVHYPRMIVLLIFGLAHYYLLWWGDILANYALVGMVAYLFWRLRTKWLLLAAVAALLLHYVPQFAQTIPRVAQIEAGLAPGAPPELRAQVEAMLAPSPALASEIAEDKAAHASIAAHVRDRTQGDAAWRPFMSVFTYGLETLGLMLLGMAGLKCGFLAGTWSRRRYAWIAATCLGSSLAVHAYAAYASLAADFAAQVYYPWTRVYVSPLHPVGAIGYAALIMLVLGRPSAIARRFAAVGRAAFTNYLGSTVVGTLLFFGTFGGLYGEFSRGELWLFAPMVWAIMLLWSPWWLDRYRYGPLECAWRSLSRWNWEPMRLPSRDSPASY
ncbi:DUF418 domain-containing protein [Altererythrobacter soli]|uniref:DUF418 domain-containing protein n=1 Tax=Croceibacterium soli TaxID=1739690 RepID=A0A6I4UPE9_9SPHN|nr:DUF418 domain-containing protein [Croceibacterium soli]MXP40801.1 DUF418 domain-containing protein [Croceibacterium soli]